MTMQSNDHKVKLLNHTNKDLKEGDLFKNHMKVHKALEEIIFTNELNRTIQTNSHFNSVTSV